MLSFAVHTLLSGISIRPVKKSTDRLIIREIFRQEFYGMPNVSFPDDGLWEIYDHMETDGLFGAYLVFHLDELLFLLEVHPVAQMDLRLSDKIGTDDVGVYFFCHSQEIKLLLPALRACLISIFEGGAMKNIFTSVTRADPQDLRVRLIEQSGFVLASDDKTTRGKVFSCNRKSLESLGAPEKMDKITIKM
jgi:hypothetical protein